MWSSHSRLASLAGRLLAVLVVFSLLAGACSSGGDDGEATSTPAPAEPTPSPPGSSDAPDGVVFVGADVDRDDPTGVATEEIIAVAAADTTLGLELLRRAGADGQNMFLSPYSVATALAMLLPGARGATADEIAAVLGVADPVRYHPVRGALDAAVLEPGEPPVEGEADVFTLRAANQLFGQDGFPFLDGYLELLARSYGADLGVVDFAADPERARALINGWVEGQTEERIVDLIPDGVISALTRLVLVNAVYFKANWFEPFDADDTIEATFTDLDGTSGLVDTMNGALLAGHVDGDGYQAVRLPYAGSTTSMLVIVPDAGTFTEVVDRLDAGELDAIRASLGVRDVQLALPVFEFRSELALKPILQDLGMVRAFLSPGPDGADLTGITEEQILFVQDALHQAFISVDEEGTEAAAATAVIVAATSAPEPVTLAVDRPFVFVIEHDATGEMLFVGQVTDLVDGSPAPAAVTAPLAADEIASIEEAFTDFFDGLGTTVDDKVARLEDGETYRTMLDAASANEQFQQMTTEIRGVRAGDPSECDGSARCAIVTHDLLVSGLPMAVAIESPAVLVGGTWLVGSSTWCSVVEIGGASCPQ